MAGGLTLGELQDKANRVLQPLGPARIFCVPGELDQHEAALRDAIRKIPMPKVDGKVITAKEFLEVQPARDQQ